MNKTRHNTKRNPWAWIPTLYFAQGLPYVAVMTISVIMYKRLGISNTDIALYTGWLYLPWVIKPFWSPFVDIIKTKRWWTLTMQWIIAFALAGIAFTIPTPFFFQLTLAIFWLVGFTSATHDIAADGFYMLALTEHEQSLYVGIRSTFYRVATVAGQGLLVIVAGLIETNTGLAPVQVNVNADPAVEWRPCDLEWTDVAEADLDGELQFITPRNFSVATTAPSQVTVDVNGESVAMPFKTYAALMRDSVKHLNERNGFVAAEIPADNKGAANVAEQSGPGAFTTWVKETFGEQREPYTLKDNNIAIIGLRLNKKPAPGEEIILNVTHKSGDQSIKLEQAALSTRFVFNESNWDKTAWLYYEIDNKLTAPTQATFEGASGNIPFAWLVVFAVLSAFFFLVAFYHSWALPRPADDGHNNSAMTASDIIREFFETQASGVGGYSLHAALPSARSSACQTHQPLPSRPHRQRRPWPHYRSGRHCIRYCWHYRPHPRRYHRRYRGSKRRPKEMAVAHGMVNVAHLPHIRLPQLCQRPFAAYRKHLRVY